MFVVSQVGVETSLYMAIVKVQESKINLELMILKRSTRLRAVLYENRPARVIRKIQANDSNTLTLSIATGSVHYRAKLHLRKF